MVNQVIEVNVTNKMIIPVAPLANAMGRQILKVDDAKFSASPWSNVVADVMRDIQDRNTLRVSNGKWNWSSARDRSAGGILSWYELISFTEFKYCVPENPEGRSLNDSTVEFYRTDKDGNIESGWNRNISNASYNQWKLAGTSGPLAGYAYPSCNTERTTSEQKRVMFNILVQNEMTENQFIKRFGLEIDQSVDIQKKSESNESFIKRFVNPAPLGNL